MTAGKLTPRMHVVPSIPAEGSEFYWILLGAQPHQEIGTVNGPQRGEQDENARRLAACWNALLPLTTDQIEAGAVQELVEALRPLAALAAEAKRIGLKPYGSALWGIRGADIYAAEAALAKWGQS